MKSFLTGITERVCKPIVYIESVVIQELTNLEREVMEMMLAGEHRYAHMLRQQMASIRVDSRDMTGVGFFTKLAVADPGSALPGVPSFRLGNVDGIADNLKHGIGFLLLIKHGRVSLLEGYTYDEPWPEQLIGVRLSYSSEQKPLSKIAEGMVDETRGLFAGGQSLSDLLYKEREKK